MNLIEITKIIKSVGGFFQSVELLVYHAKV